VSDGVNVVDIDGEAVLYDTWEHQLHYLNHSAALVLDLCDGTSTVKQMADAIADVYEMDADEIGRQIRPVVRNLRSLHVVDPPPREEQLVAGTNGASAATAHQHLDERELVRMEVPRNA
jgi:hypothetical protein